ncbi:MAG TPA: TetR/AcrR family transcriptional regulator [Casimicrobiaceae bacterium]|nr:TetR/AcrR family transcriptional regulator [Casimicrobiaceae bacterium]
MQGTQDKLPRGRHNLSRADVSNVQRARMLRAMADVVAERGYVDTPVAAVIERAGVSRETFYQQFASKQDCFVAALEETIGRLAASLAAVLEHAEGTPLERYDALLRGYLDTVRAQPATARLFLIQTYAAGPDAMRRRLELQQQFVDAIVRIFGVRSAQGRFHAESLVATTISAVTARFVTDDVPALALLRPKLLALAATLFN